MIILSAGVGEKSTIGTRSETETRRLVVSFLFFCFLLGEGGGSSAQAG